MINYKDAEPVSVLPLVLAENPDIASISYAYKMAMERIITLRRRTSLYADIDNIEDEVLLDLMALEFRTQYYDEELPVAIKKSLIKNTLSWYQRAGTAGAVQEVLYSVIGSGEVIEWFDTGDEPGTFQIFTTEPIGSVGIELLNKMLSKIKKAGSALKAIQTGQKLETSENIAAIFSLSMHIVIR